MTADVTQDRRVTVPGLGSSDSAFVDGSRLFWALPSPVHERSGYGSSRPTGYKLMRSLPHARTRPNPGNHVNPLTARTLCPDHLESRAALAAVKAATRRLRRWPAAMRAASVGMTQ